MSTRSGKRLHNSPNENIEPELILKKDRKTRNKHVVENGDGQGVLFKTKKRQNYVSFPADGETVTSDAVADEVQLKSARALRRNTLKEQNAVTEEVETAISTKKQARSLRRTKKLSETAVEEASEVPQNEEPVAVVIVTNGKTKSKKSKKKSKKTEPMVTDKENEVKVVKIKKNKKKKNLQSKFLVEQEEVGEKRKNESNVSTDSFHSAAGSPARQDVTSPLNKSSPKCMETENKRRSNLKRISGLNTSTQVSMEVDEHVNTNIEKEAEIVEVRQSKRRRSSLKIMPDQNSKSLDTNEKVDLNSTFEKEPTNEGSNKKKRKYNITVEDTDIPVTNSSSKLDIAKMVLNTTFEKDDTANNINIHKNIKSHTKCKVKEIAVNISPKLNTSFEKRRSPRKSVNASENMAALNGTFDMSPNPDQTKQKSLDSTFDKETKLDSTFDQETKLDSTFDKSSKKPSLGSKSSLITSDDATNSSIVTLDKSDASKISITDDDSKTENILNTTPLLIESSMEESKVLESSLKENKIPEPQIKPMTPLKREGTFTKECSEASVSPKTPNKRQTLPAAGCTPYHSNGKVSQQKRSILNRTHSIEKPGRRSSLAEVLPRAPRVMFCSPVNNPGVATQRKSKIIKSNLKGSNKSFVFDESMSSQWQLPERASRAGRKRSRTQADAAPGSAKRGRTQQRSSSAAAAAKPTPGTPLQGPTPRSELQATRLPNFAALHARRFDRMESLDECQLRRARRARQLLVPTGGLAVLQRSPAVTMGPKPKATPPKTAAPAKPAPKLPTLDTLQRGYTRFGFKMNCDVNPFSIPPKTAEKKPNETKTTLAKTIDVKKPNGVNKLNGVTKPNGVSKPVVGLKRQGSQPSLAGTTSLRREVAKQTIMREKSFTLAEKRNETRKEVRTVIKGVRTNRRFELQMKSRNING